MGVNQSITLSASRIMSAAKTLPAEENYIPPEKRAFERFPSNLQARLFYGNMIYSGMITNISRKGMFVKTNVKFPVNSRFMMVVLFDQQPLKFPIKVRRVARRAGDQLPVTDNGIGLELLNAPQSYLDYVGSRKSTMQFAY